MAYPSRNDTVDARLFPMALAPFESMMLYDDRPDYPMMCSAEFTFEGELDRSKFENAFDCARRRHPLFCAHIAERRCQPHRWIAASVPAPFRFVDSLEELETSEFTPIDLRCEVGLRLAICSTGRQTRLLFDFHHACSDGVGGLSFIEDVLACYDAEFHARPPVLPTRDPWALRQRGNFPGATGISLQRLYNECTDIVETGRFFGQAPVSLANGPSMGLRLVPNVATTRMVSRTLPSDVLVSLRNLAASSQVTVNDLLVQSLFTTMRDWNLSRGEDRPSDCFRILIPTTLRTRADLTMPATNRLGYTFYSRRLGDLHQPARVLEWLRLESARLRQTRFPERVLSKLSILSCIPWGLPMVLSPRRCLATAVLSNVGDPTRRFQARFARERGRLVAGNLVLTGLTAMTPIRPNTRVTLFVNTYSNHLTISVRLDPLFFQSADGYVFLDQLIANLLASAQLDELRQAA